ncbi:MAG: hypothetical protein ACRDRI_04375 [Pseudonocardiaceae bacterium]
MSPLSPVVAAAFRMLRDGLRVHLDEAHALADQDDEWSEADVAAARELINGLVVVIRGLLTEHTLQSSGDCQTCILPWPCPVFTTIHVLVKDPQRRFLALLFRANNTE